MNLDRFAKGWVGSDKPSIKERMKRLVDRQPLRYKIMLANYKIKTMIVRLEAYIARLKERDAALFERVVESLQQGDKQRAAVYAAEVAEVRKVIKQLMTMKLVLEQVSLRLETIMTLGDMATALAPVISVIHEIRNYVRGALPMLGLELAEIEETLNSVVVESGEFVGAVSVSPAASLEAQKILREAAVLAEQKLREQFPEIPSTVSEAEGAKAANL